MGVAHCRIANGLKAVRDGTPVAPIVQPILKLQAGCVTNFVLCHRRRLLMRLAVIGRPCKLFSRENSISAAQHLVECIRQLAFFRCTVGRYDIVKRLGLWWRRFAIEITQIVRVEKSGDVFKAAVFIPVPKLYPEIGGEVFLDDRRPSNEMPPIIVRQIDPISL